MDPWVFAPLRVATPKDDEVAKVPAVAPDFRQRRHPQTLARRILHASLLSGLGESAASVSVWFC